jgi:hypothetical protein
MKLSIKILQSHDEIIANCPELDINCYGSDRDEAVRRIRKVIDFYVDSAKELGLDVDSFSDISVEGEMNRGTAGGYVIAHPESIN